MKREHLLFIAPLIALGLASGLYLLFMSSFHHYDQEGDRFFQVLKTYPGLPQESTIFLGESQVREDIDCAVMEKKSKRNNWCFNLGFAGMLPVQIALQSEMIIQAKPKVVVVGVTASFFNEDMNKNNDFFLLLNGKKRVQKNKENKEIIELLTADEKKLLLMNFYEKAVYKRKFILPFYFALLKQLVSPFSTDSSTDDRSGAVQSSKAINLKNPHLFTKDESKENLAAKLEKKDILKIFYF